MKNLVAQITPSVKVAQPSKSIFQEPTIINADYMLALARPYGLGSENVKFQIIFGSLINNEEKVFFENLQSADVVLTKEELASWGTDDEECYNVIAGKLGVQINSFVTADIQGY